MQNVILSIYNIPILSTINYISFTLLSLFRDNTLTIYHSKRRIGYQKSSTTYYISQIPQLAVTQYNLGVMYALGQGVPQNIQYAIELFEEAKDQGDKDAQKMLEKLK